MGLYDILLILSWVVVVVTFSLAACLTLGADWHDLWLRLTRRSIGR